MIIGMGLDLVSLERIAQMLEKHPQRFPNRICRPGEVQPRVGAARVQHIGGLFAAKEAVMKALGTGWDKGVSFRQIEISRTAGGAPSVILHHEARALAESRAVSRIHLSITHERDHAAAVAVLESD